MTIRVVCEYPSHRGIHRLVGRVGRSVGRLLGGFLVSGSVIAWVSVVILAPGAFPPEPHLTGFAIAFAIATALTLLGRRLMRGRRRLVLFLRRFGFVGATEVITFAINTAIGGSWRVVTLDDQEIAPLGTGRGPHWRSILGGVVGIAILAGLYWLVVLPAVRWSDAVVNYDYFGAFLSAFPSWLALILLPVAFLLLPVVVVVAVAVLLGLVVLLSLMARAGLVVGSQILYLWGRYVAVQRAERAKKFRIEDRLEVDTIVRLLARRSRRVFAARLAVVRVASPVWHEA